MNKTKGPPGMRVLGTCILGTTAQDPGYLSGQDLLVEVAERAVCGKHGMGTQNQHVMSDESRAGGSQVRDAKLKSLGHPRGGQLAVMLVAFKPY